MEKNEAISLHQGIIDELTQHKKRLETEQQEREAVIKQIEATIGKRKAAIQALLSDGA